MSNGQYLISLTLDADGKMAVRQVTEATAAEKGLEAQAKRSTQTTRNASAELERYMASLRKEVETLGMSRSQIRLYEAARMGASAADLRAIQVSNQLIDAHQRKVAGLRSGMEELAAMAGRLGAAVSAVAIVKHLADASDNATLLAARVGLVVNGLTLQKKVQAELFETAQQLQLPYVEMANQFPRIARAVQGYGGSVRDAIDINKIFAQTVRISGATQMEATASAVQFAQALQSGRLAGDELKSVLENNGLLAEYLAKGLNVTQGELRQLGEEGRLTSEKVVKALLSQQAAIAEAAEKIPRTVRGSFTALENEIDRTTTSSDTFSYSVYSLIAAVDLFTAAIKRMREEGSFDLPFLSTPMQIVAGFQNRDRDANNLWDMFVNKKPKPASGTRDFRRGEIDYYNEVNGPQTQAQATAQRVIRDLVKESETATGVNARYTASVEKITDAWRAAAAAGTLTAEVERDLSAMIAAEGVKRQLAMEGLAKKGQASLESEVELVKKRSELQAAGAEAFHQLQAGSIQSALAAEEHYHRAGLTGEREYIEARARLQTDATQNEINRLTGALAREEALLAALRGRKGVAPTEQVRHQGDIAEQEKKVLAARTQLTLATRKLADVEEDRGRGNVLLDQKILGSTLAIKREREDYRRGVEREIEDMQFQVELIGMDELAQAKANAQRQIHLRYLDRRLELERKLADLRRKGGSPEDIADVEASLEDLERTTREAAERIGPILEEQFRKELFKRIGDAVADAIVDGGPDAAKRLRSALEDELKKPFKVAISRGVQQFMQNPGAIFNPGAWTQDQQMAVAGMAGGVFGGLAANAAGAGERGQQAATSYAAAGASIGTAILPGWGTVIGAVVGALAGIFSDPAGNAERTGRVGVNPQGQYTYAGRSPFGGRFGVWDDRWFSDEDMGEDIQRFLAAQGQFELSLSRRMSPEERARASAALSGSSEYGFGTEQGRTMGLGEILRDRLEAIVEAAMPGLGRLVQAFEGTGEELVRFVESLFGMRDSLSELDQMIAVLTNDGITNFREQLRALEETVTKAKANLSDALASGDAAEIYAAEQALARAVMDRYQTEIQMVEQLRDAIAELKEEAYQFQLSIAQRINAVGGSRDIGAIALGRAASLRGGIGGNYNIPGQVRDLNRYVGVIDTWYQVRRSEIERQMAAEQQALQAIAQAQQAAAQARIAQLQGELAVAQQFRGIVDATRAMLDDLRLSSANPAPLLARVAMAGADVQSLMTRYRAATGEERADLASRILEAISTYRELGQEAFQRPSPEWQAIYNEITRDLTEVQDDARTFAERSLEIERSILEVQTQAAGYQAAIAGAAAASNAYLEALNQEALGYYEWAEIEGERLYALQERLQQEQLDAITGGMDVELFIAARQREAVDELREIRRLIALFLSTAGTDTTAPPPGGGTTTTTTTTGGNPIGRGSTVILQLDGRELGRAFIPTIDARMDARATAYGRRLNVS